MIFTFSTKTKRPKDTELIEEVKKYCEENHLNFSSVVISQLAKFKKEVMDGRPN